MRSEALVSIVTIFLNAEKFIQEMIDSVVQQKYPHWHLVLVDDGSTDASTEIARHFAGENPNKAIYLEHAGHQNRGCSASRNLGLTEAKGEYVAFLDADDVWPDFQLEQQVRLLNAHPEAGMLYGNSLYWYSWTQDPKDRRRDYTPELRVQPGVLYQPCTLLPMFLEGKAMVPCPCSVLVRRDAVESTHGFEEWMKELYDDQVLYAKLSLRYPILASDNCWGLYRQHGDSQLGRPIWKEDHYLVRLAFLEWLERYMIEQNVTDAILWRALRRQRWVCKHYRSGLWPRLPERVRYAWRLAKKRLLRSEEFLLPEPFRRYLWDRNTPVVGEPKRPLVAFRTQGDE